MLVLSRRLNETLILRRENCADIEVKLLRIKGRNEVSLGIAAEQAEVIVRKELDKKGKGNGQWINSKRFSS